MGSIEDVNSYIENQLAAWPLAKQNYDALVNVRRRAVKIRDFDMQLQCNPARIVSTGAKIDKKSITNRKCFLCRENRPEEQLICEILPGWEMLVNPFPILPVHFTIASTEHQPQSRVPTDILSLAEKLPGMVLFFNGAKAGASAPDHMHMQAVLKDELPLMRLAEQMHHSDNSGIMLSSDFGLDLPYFFISGVVSPDKEGLSTLKAGLTAGGPDAEGRLLDPELVNSFFWIDRSGMLRYVVVPRKAHRPQCYYAEGDGNRMISPGCIDMAGLIVAPRENDYLKLTVEEIEKIYEDVAVPGNLRL